MRREVLRWGDTHRRDLPWRHTRDPWAVLAAEVMLQQTQVQRVVPRWEEFLGCWPEPAALARTPLGELLVWWQGLGYPRRARNLRAAAAACVELHGGSVPDRLDLLLALPGVGHYTARAVLAFAYERDVGVVDTNIGRVLARLGNRHLGPNEAQHLADALAPAGAGWAWNQTLLDLGALLCRPEPHCGECPLRDGCSWRSAGRPEPDPASRSAAVSRRQARYRGSMRQVRGAVLAALADGPLDPDRLTAAVDASLDAVEIDRARVVEAIVALRAEGLLEHADGSRWALPGRSAPG